jgi:hypothetical protein
MEVYLLTQMLIEMICARNCRGNLLVGDEQSVESVDQRRRFQSKASKN